MDFHKVAIAGELLLVVTACNQYKINHWTISRLYIWILDLDS